MIPTNHPFLNIILPSIALTFGLSSTVLADAETSGFSIDATTRIGAQAGYYRHFVPSQNFVSTMGWTGSVTTCNPGTVSSEFLGDCQRRINYYRAQVGLPADILLTDDKNEKSQWAALIMARENNLSHNPATDFPTNACVVADKLAHAGSSWGDEAAGASNLSLGSYGPEAIYYLMVDSGASNGAAGHRRWLLNPLAQEMGVGAIPAQTNPLYDCSTCVWVVGDFKPASEDTVKLVTYPNAGFIPYSQIPNPTNTVTFGGQIYWSCSYTLADFTSATVSMTRTVGAAAPVAVGVTKQTYEEGVGDNTLVWLVNSPSSIVAPSGSQDVSYTVTVSNISVPSGNVPAEFEAVGSSYRYTYTITSFDPTYLGTPISLTGSAAPSVGLPSTYNFTTLPEASGYRVRVGKLSSATWTEGAEDSPAPKITSGISAISPYSLRTTALAYAGKKSFHLAFPTSDPSTQRFTINRDLIPTTSSKLTFKQRFRYFTKSSKLSVEISSDGGSSWKSIYSRAGVTNSGSSTSWEAAWKSSSVTIPAAYAGKAVRIRFSISKSGSYFPGVSSMYGVFIDNITMSNAKTLTTVSTTELDEDVASFDFTPSSAGDYVLQAQTEMGDNQWFEYGPFLPVTATTVVARP